MSDPTAAGIEHPTDGNLVSVEGPSSTGFVWELITLDSQNLNSALARGNAASRNIEFTDQSVGIVRISSDGSRWIDSVDNDGSIDMVKL